MTTEHKIVENVDRNQVYLRTLTWDSYALPVRWIMLHPRGRKTFNTETQRAMDYSRNMGAGSCIVVYLYGQICRSVTHLLDTSTDPIGPVDRHIKKVCGGEDFRYLGPPIVAWGPLSRPDMIKRRDTVLGLLGKRDLVSLGATPKGQPRSVLNADLNQELVPWAP